MVKDRPFQPRKFTARIQPVIVEFLAKEATMPKMYLPCYKLLYYTLRNKSLMNVDNSHETASAGKASPYVEYTGIRGMFEGPKMSEARVI